jgi:hypothetical protein
MIDLTYHIVGHCILSKDQVKIAQSNFDVVCKTMLDDDKVLGKSFFILVYIFCHIAMKNLIFQIYF